MACGTKRSKPRLSISTDERLISSSLLQYFILPYAQITLASSCCSNVLRSICRTQAMCSVATNGLDVICLTQDTLRLYQTQGGDQGMVGLMITYWIGCNGTPCHAPHPAATFGLDLSSACQLSEIITSCCGGALLYHKLHLSACGCVHVHCAHPVCNVIAIVIFAVKDQTRAPRAVYRRPQEVRHGDKSDAHKLY